MVITNNLNEISIMKKLMLLSVCAMVLLSSCVSKKDYLALEAQQKETQDLLNSATVKLNSCLADAAAANARVEALKTAQYITPNKAGNGAVLDACLHIIEKFFR